MGAGLVAFLLNRSQSSSPVPNPTHFCITTYTHTQEEILEVISTSRHAGLTVIQVISKYFVERAHYVVKVTEDLLTRGEAVAAGDV